jgi:hypothetical protein
MKSEDETLERYFKALRDLHPSDFQLQQWKTGVRHERKKVRRSHFSLVSRRWAPMVAALFVGFVLGGLAFRLSASHDSSWIANKNNNESFATIEHIVAKAE